MDDARLQQLRDAARAEVEDIRRRARADAEAQRAEIAQERAAIADAAAAVADDQDALAADRDRLRVDRADLARQRADLADREGALQERTAAVDRRQVDLDAARSDLETIRIDLEASRVELAQAREAHAAERQAELARISSLTVEEARAELLTGQEDAVRRDAALMIRRIETEAQSTAKQRARAIVADAIQRVASDQTSQSVVTVLQLPSDDLKGRIIGREGRNIRAFETVTGVNVIIDDTPEAVLLSCFDPVRREVGRVTLQALIDDGRIHPHRIEEAYDRAYDEVESLCQRAAEDALLAVGISDIHPELVTLIGRLKYRTSYGQNVLGHLIETSHIARLIAAELGIDPTVVARGAFLHDIGKALTHEAQGSHAIVGADIARRYGESADVVHCIEAHHDEVPPTTVEAVLTQAADACSGGRPGARRESLESYVQRLEHIEAIASAKKGVEKVFAMQAGRELRVMVKPDVVDDLEAHVMAREVAKQIEEELTYPGQVRVTVIRESRATEIAR
jgi:ribonuclease Y